MGNPKAIKKSVHRSKPNNTRGSNENRNILTRSLAAETKRNITTLYRETRRLGNHYNHCIQIRTTGKKTRKWTYITASSSSFIVKPQPIKTLLKSQNSKVELPKSPHKFTTQKSIYITNKYILLNTNLFTRREILSIFYQTKYIVS